MEPIVARKTWRTLEPIHGLVYFAPEQTERYEVAGVGGAAGYFASRSAAMGPVDAEVVVATFFNFEPGFVRRSLDGVWQHTTPAIVLAARADVAATALRRVLGDEATGPQVDEAAGLAARAALAAAERPEGRPLFAGHTSVPWPDPADALLTLWHAQTLLREFRGDGHVAALTAHDLTGCEALVLHAATGEVPAAILQATRAWSDDAWAAAVERLRGRGWLDADGAFTDAGRRAHQAIEDRTDVAALAPYRVLGTDGCERLRALARPLSRAITRGGGLRPSTTSRTG
jgi:hypothetical protein